MDTSSGNKNKPCKSLIWQLLSSIQSLERVDPVHYWTAALFDECWRNCCQTLNVKFDKNRALNPVMFLADRCGGLIYFLEQIHGPLCRPSSSSCRGLGPITQALFLAQPPPPNSEGPGYLKFLCFLSIIKILKFRANEKWPHHKKQNCPTIIVILVY